MPLREWRSFWLWAALLICLYAGWAAAQTVSPPLPRYDLSSQQLSEL